MAMGTSSPATAKSPGVLATPVTKVDQLNLALPSLPVPRCACRTGDQGWSALAYPSAHFRSCGLNPQGAVGGGNRG